MDPQEAEMAIEDALMWFGDKTSSEYVHRATGISSCGAVWIVPTFGYPSRVQVGVKDVMNSVLQAGIVLQSGPASPPDPELLGRALTFVNQCMVLISLCED